MINRNCVFVDGENFRHNIVELFYEFDQADYLPKQAEWENFFNWVVECVSGPDASRVRTYWYVVSDIDFFPYRFPDPYSETEKLRRLLSKDYDLRAELEQLNDEDQTARMVEIVKAMKNRQRGMVNRFDGWSVIQHGISTRHQAIEFRKAGAIRFDLFDGSFGQEKSIDVKMATDMILLREVYDTAIIVSGDQDYAPAVQAVKDAGKRAVNVSFEMKSGKILSGGARRLDHVTDWNLNVAYQDLERFLKI